MFSDCAPPSATSSPSYGVQFQSFDLDAVVWYAVLAERRAAGQAFHALHGAVGLDPRAPETRLEELWERLIEHLGRRSRWSFAYSRSTGGWSHCGMWTGPDDDMIVADMGRARLTLTVASTDRRRPPPILQGLLELAAPYAWAAKRRPDQVPVRFWHRTQNGPDENDRLLQCPAWEEIRDNYPGCADPLDRLFALQAPWQLGRLVFWHGPPGTGKTWALRALLRAWRGLSAEVIADPEAFFSDPDYFSQVLMASPSPYLAADDEDGPDPAGTEPVREHDGPRGRVFVVEDAPDLVLKESNERSSYMLGRLLNLTDGILGQGTRTVLVITTNSEVERIHPALTRPGRCLQTLHFGPFDATGAARWLDGRGRRDLPAPSRASLAELFALAEGRAEVDHGPGEPIGFRRPPALRGAPLERAPTAADGPAAAG